MNKHTRWFLVSSSGLNIPLSQTMISFGKEVCDVVLQSKSVDLRHAVLTFDHYENCFKVKDLNSINGTYLNDIRIPSQTFVKLEHLDSLRFGFDLVVYQVQVVEQIPVPANSAYHQLYAWGRGLPYHSSRYPHSLIKMNDCQGCLHKVAGRHTCDTFNLDKDHRHRPPLDQQSTDAAKNHVPMFTGNGDRQPDYCGNFISAAHHPGHAGWGVVPLNPGDLTASQPPPRRSDLGPSLTNASFCQSGGHGTPCRVEPGTVHPSCESSVAGVQQQRFGVPPNASGMPANVPTPNAVGGNVGHPRTSSPAVNFANGEGAGNGTRLQGNFSGDSLDLNHDNQEDATLTSSGGDATFVVESPEKELAKSRRGPLARTEMPPSLMTSSDSALELRSKRGRSGFPDQDSSKKDLGLSQSGSATPKRDSPTDESKTPRPNCTAFTIDFTDVCAPSSSSASKKLDIKDKISKFAPPKPDGESKVGHRRTASTPKVPSETEKKKTTMDQSPAEELESPTAEIIMAARARLVGAGFADRHHRGSGSLSDGQGSSDRDDDISAKSDPVKQTRGGSAEVTVRKDKTSRGQGAPAVKKGRTLPVVGLRDSAKYLIEKMFGQVAAPANSPTEPASPPLTQAKKDDSGGSSSKKAQKEESKKARKNASNWLGLSSTSAATATTDVRGVADGGDVAPSAAGTPPDTGTYLLHSRGASNRKPVEDDHVQEIDFSDDNDEDEYTRENGVAVVHGGGGGGGGELATGPQDERSDDEVSEAGTYTIENDRENGEEALARQKIDAVFGVTDRHSTGPGFQRPVVDSQTGEDAGVELRKKRDHGPDTIPLNATFRKGQHGWLKDWGSATVDLSEKSPSSPQRPISAGLADLHPRSAPAAPGVRNGQDSAGWPATDAKVPRQRRKLPAVPPANKTPAPAQEKFWTTSSSSGGGSDSPEGQHSDGSLDTETILKETETVVSAMEARMEDHCRQADAEQRREEEAAGDSGGESDADTSNASTHREAYPPSATGDKSSRTWRGGKPGLLAAEEDRHRHRHSVATSGHHHHHATADRGNRRSLNTTFTSPASENEYSCHSEGETASVHSDVSSSSDLSGSSPRCRRKSGGPAGGTATDKPPLMKFNRAFSLRRARLGCDAAVDPRLPPAVVLSRPSSASSTGSATTKGPASVPATTGGPMPRASSAATSGGRFERSDGGRFSLRVPRGAPVPARPSAAKGPSKRVDGRPSANSCGGGGSAAKTTSPRSNSTLSAKELEMKNWRRRKEYDPLKAAAEGRKKEAARKGGGVGPATGSEGSSCEAPAFQRSASFHGTDGLALLHGHEYKSEENLEMRSDGGDFHPAFARGWGHVAHVATRNFQEPPPRLGHKKNSEDDSTADSAKTPDGSGATCESGGGGSQLVDPLHRHKNKIEALDNLVISTVHQVSRNLRNNTECILKKLGQVHGQDCDHSLGDGGLEELLSRVARVRSPETSPRGQSVSKQLSGILKNMKCLEESLQAIDRVLSAAQSGTGEFQRADVRIQSDDGDSSYHSTTSTRAKNELNGFRKKNLS